MGEVSYNDCDCVPGHKCDCWEAAAAARTALLDELETAVGRLEPTGDAGYYDNRWVNRAAVLAEINRRRP